MFISEKKLAELINKAVTDALTMEMTLEKVTDEKTGQPLAVPERITEKVFLPSFIAQNLKYHEGALRGVQEQTCKQSADISELGTKIKIIGNVLIDAESSLKFLSTAANKISQIETKSERLIRS